jgi:hypothetical protein
MKKSSLKSLLLLLTFLILACSKDCKIENEQKALILLYDDSSCVSCKNSAKEFVFSELKNKDLPYLLIVKNSFSLKKNSIEFNSYPPISISTFEENHSCLGDLSGILLVYKSENTIKVIKDFNK